MALYKLKKCIAHSSNYGGKRSLTKIEYIVIHFTANDGDTDENNGKYFKNNIVKASAHYFVDDDSVTQSVPDNYIAYAVGGSKYSDCGTTGGGKYYGKCTNSNSISIEICDDRKNGTIYPSAQTIANAITLTKDLMKKYNIPASRVIRHFDVNGKRCPGYWCGSSAKNKKWKTEFHNKLTEAKQTETKKEVKDLEPYKVKITSETLNVRAGAGTSYEVVTQIEKDEVYTIVEEKKNESTTWGKLKSGVGWISLSYAKRV